MLGIFSEKLGGWGRMIISGVLLSEFLEPKSKGVYGSETKTQRSDLTPLCGLKTSVFM